MSDRTPISRWISRHLAEHAPRTRSLLVTLFGDSIEPHGGTIWMGSLVRLLAPFGIHERNVRTSVFRLAKEDWLESTGERIGKRSYYRMTTAARLRTAHAHRRIYGPPTDAWTGTWTLLLLEAGASIALRRELLWEGFGRLSVSVYAHPAPDARTLQEILATHGAEGALIGFQARAMTIGTSDGADQLVRRGWALAQLARQYDLFQRHFGALENALAQGDVADDQCFMLRTLLIHEYRRAQLRDPLLPTGLMPVAWPGTRARELCRSLYLACSPGAERHLVQTAEGMNGPLPPPAPYFFERFTDVSGKGPRPNA